MRLLLHKSCKSSGLLQNKKLLPLSLRMFSSLPLSPSAPLQVTHLRAIRTVRFTWSYVCADSTKYPISGEEKSDWPGQSEIAYRMEMSFTTAGRERISAWTWKILLTKVTLALTYLASVRNERNVINKRTLGQIDICFLGVIFALHTLCIQQECISPAETGKWKDYLVKSLPVWFITQ